MTQIATVPADASLAERAAANINRHTDVSVQSQQTKPAILPPLPPVNWGALGQQAPVRIPIGARRPTDPLPLADWVIITWTSAEWQALDHVFLNRIINPQVSPANNASDTSLPVSAGSPQVSAIPVPVPPDPSNPSVTLPPGAIHPALSHGPGPGAPAISAALATSGAAATGTTLSPDWKKDWFPYSRNTGPYTAAADSLSGDLWGLFQMVEVIDQGRRPWRVLLFKSNAHLAHAPWAAGLSAMLQAILADTKADRVYTIGTAGGARQDQRLGDTVITNTATLELIRPENSDDPGNGHAFRCPSWYPVTSFIPRVQDQLLYRLDSVATPDFLGQLLDQLKARHANDPFAATLRLDDLLNDALDPASLHSPRIISLEDSPLLSTDFYAVAAGDSTAAFAFLEMDDAIIAREANAAGARFACIRNISDPIVVTNTRTGAIIPDPIREDWSGIIYNSFGLYTSFNGALASWATIAGEGSSSYGPARSSDTPDKEDPIEVKLVYQVISCGTCKFFWPDDKHQAPYGPYPAFDFDVNFPYEANRLPGSAAAPWTIGRTAPPSFPNPEIMAGCRKAPIMTIGINPALSSFSPGQNGTACAYPNFSSKDFTNAWSKYAWYYRYRSVYQETLSFAPARQFVLPDGQVIATHDGKMMSATRADDNPSWTIHVRYAGSPSDMVITLPGLTGDFPYMLFYDIYEPHNAFKAGDILAGKVAIPEGIRTEIYQEEQGYYTQFLPTLKKFENYLKTKGHIHANLRIGEDVSELDMVACSSPHWSEGFLGNQMQTIVDNCTSKNAWLIKQFVQSRPAVLYIVSESSWDMFRKIFGKFIDPGRISDIPADQSYTLLRETTNPDRPVYVSFDLEIDGIPYKSRTRLVITPHFSYGSNFYPQYRLSPEDFASVSALPGFPMALTAANGFTILDGDPLHPAYYREVQLQSATAAASRARLQQDAPDLFSRMESFYYDPGDLMASVLAKMYDNGELIYDDTKQYLARTDGACRFCINSHWQFPAGCKYGKPAEIPEPPGFLEKVAAYIVANGKA